jgi:cation diffusion facilitator CzcD-associated flavoprotein CzcO
MGNGICVIGAGGSGLAAVRALSERGLEVTCFERGSAVGGTWRYENDSGLSPAYASLRTNTSRKRTQYPSFPMPASYGDYIDHRDMSAYFEAYAAMFKLQRHIRFGATVESARPQGDGWRVRLEGGEEHRYWALIVAIGHYWDPKLPTFPGEFSGAAIHSSAYRTPERFAGQRVLVVGASQSGLELAAELAEVTARTFVSCRRGYHVFPRYLLGRPTDSFDAPAPNHLPWRFVRGSLGALFAVTRARPPRGGFPAPLSPILEETEPVLATAKLAEALGTKALSVKPNVERLDGSSVHFADGSAEAVDAIVYATGYRISFPFLSPDLVPADGTQFPLYRRIASPRADGLYFVGILEPGPGLLAIVERQSAWLAERLSGRLTLPPRERMWAAIDAGERRTRRRFSESGPHTVLCDSHAYMRVLARDLKRKKDGPSRG